MKYLLCIILIFLFQNEENLKQKELIIYYPLEKPATIMDVVVNHIKQFEGLHINNPLYIGYGHKIKNKSELSITNYDSLLRADLMSNLAYFKGNKDSLALSMLSYNIGVTKVLKSSLMKEFDRNKRDSIWISYCYYNGKPVRSIKERRQWEINNLLR
jgi:GH24 family phage-related lysozyme (muramidase)